MMAAVALAFASCSSTDDVYDANRSQVQDDYNNKFIQAFGRPASNQDWGFGSNYSSAPAFDAFGLTRGISNPAVAEADQPWTEEDVATYLETAKEPDATNTWDNYDNSWSGYEDDYTSWNDQTGTWNQKWVVKPDPTYVTNFKITGEWNDFINVLATEDADGDPRTVVVTGTWNLTTNQVVGGKGRIIVANGGTLNIADGVTLSSVNEAQIVVLAGGKITGKGSIAFHNGTDSDLLSGNWGTIEVGKFNNNGGNYYNYGTLKADVMDGGAGDSRYYNHSIINIGQTGSSANLRIYNGCQFYCAGDMRARNYEGVMGSSLICDGQLTMSGSEDGTTEASYVGLQSGALVQAGSLYNNGTSWAGPTSNGYAVLSIGQFDFLNWQQDAPATGGYFANNIYVQANTWTNTPGGNGSAGETAEVKFANVKNATGNGNVTIVEKGDYEVIPADNGFVKGQKECTPGFKIKKEEEPSNANIRIIAEDLSVQDVDADFDFNDVVFDVRFISDTEAEVTVKAAGGTLPLKIGSTNGVGGYEVHGLFGQATDVKINTHSSTGKFIENQTATPVTISGINKTNNGKDIRIEVQKGDTWYEITANAGEPAAKIGVDPKFKWVNEKHNITNDYPQFSSWVKNPSIKWY